MRRIVSDLRLEALARSSCRFVGLLLLVVHHGDCMRRGGDHVFYATDLIEVVDPLKHGFDVVLTESANQYLLVNPFQLPAIYVTAIPLKANSKSKPNTAASFRQILFKESIVNKMIKIHGLEERSWYYVCVEFETIGIGSTQNQTTGTQCRIRRTLDKFGKGAVAAESVIVDVRLLTVAETLLEIELQIDANFPLSLTVYLEDGSAAARLYVLEPHQPRSLKVVFSDLLPDTPYGRVCVIEEPLVHAYSAMGRAIGVRARHCYLDGKDLKTKAEISNAAEKLHLSREFYSSYSKDDNRASGGSVAHPHALCSFIYTVQISFLLFIALRSSRCV